MTETITPVTVPDSISRRFVPMPADHPDLFTPRGEVPWDLMLPKQTGWIRLEDIYWVERHGDGSVFPVFSGKQMVSLSPKPGYDVQIAHRGFTWYALVDSKEALMERLSNPEACLNENSDNEELRKYVNLEKMEQIGGVGRDLNIIFRDSL